MSAHDAWYGKTDDGHLLEFRWDTRSKPSNRKGGMTGQAYVLRSSGGDFRDGACHRVHKCAHNPCSARWPPSKYGLDCPPMHLQEVSASETSQYGMLPPMHLPENEAAAPEQVEPAAPLQQQVNEAAAPEQVEPAAPLQQQVEPENDAAVPIPSSVPLRSGHIPTAVAMSPSCPLMRMGCPQLPAVAEASLFMESEHKVFQLILELARSIRSPRTYVGYTFFVLLGICKNCQPVMWEGSERVNLLEKYAPWALPSAEGDCAVDAVVCCMRSLPTGRAELLQVSEDQPLADCRHFVACHKMTTSQEREGDSIEAFYGRLGIVLLSTDMDGDCGVDTACRMLGLPTNASSREELRREIADYLLERHATPWMHQLLAVCEELPMEDVERFRSGGTSSLGVGLTSENGDTTAVAVNTETTSAVAVNTDEECRIVVDTR